MKIIDRLKEWQLFLAVVGMFLLFYFFPLGLIPFKGPFYESLALVKWYAREHVLLCLVPAFFIAGAISVFLSQASVIKYLGPQSNRWVSYGVASVSGSILAVCSCTVLPLFSGIYKRGAGLGPAVAFLYAGPAVNVLAIILTARVLGLEIGFARAIGAILFSIVIGLFMHLIFKKEEQERLEGNGLYMGEVDEERPLWKTVLYFGAMIGILVFANWGSPQEGETGFWQLIFQYKWWVSGLLLTALVYMIFRWFQNDERVEWVQSSWQFTKQILPLLFLGVLAAGILLGRPGQEGIIPSSLIAGLVGGNSWLANFFASIVGAFMYFATLTEVPILEGLMGAGMGKGPALALLLSGPALSLPNMLIIRGVLGTKKTIVYVMLVIIMATISGIIYGAIAT
jgi:uncharacterized membrane protein YraQ (UPF0718 family)